MKKWVSIKICLPLSTCRNYTLESYANNLYVAVIQLPNVDPRFFFFIRILALRTQDRQKKAQFEEVFVVCNWIKVFQGMRSTS